MRIDFYAGSLSWLDFAVALGILSAGVLSDLLIHLAGIPR